MLSQSRQNLLVAILVLIVFVAMLTWSLTLGDHRGEEFPALVSTVAVILCLLDILAHTDSRLGRRLAMVLSGTLDATSAPTHSVNRELIAIAWLVGATALMVVAGFLVAIPVYVFGYMLLYARRSVRAGAIAAVATTVCIWVGFELLLRYELYRGLLAPG